MANKIRLKQVDVDVTLPSGLISSSAQLDGSTLKNITISTANSDRYSLIVSGALAIVDANNLPDGGFNDIDTNVPGQLWLNGGNLPTDPSISGSGVSNIIDQGEF
jgi:hypothetical protein